MKKKKMGKRERGKGKGGGRCAPAATAAAVGHAWRRHACAGHGRWGARPGGEEGNRREGKKRGEIRGGRTRRVGWEKDGTWIEFGCWVDQEKPWELGFGV